MFCQFTKLFFSVSQSALIHIQTIEINLLETYMIKNLLVNITVCKEENNFSKIV